MKQDTLNFDLTTEAPRREYTTEEVIQQLVEQIKRDTETLRMPLTYQSPNPEFYRWRIEEYRAKVLELRQEVK